jgi:hypothetical protein
MLPLSHRAERLRSAALLLLATALLSGCVADLRPAALKRRDRAEEEACGRAVLAAAAQRQHAEGAAPWSSLSGVGVRFTDTYFGLIGALACPWPTDPAVIEMSFLPGTDVSTATFSASEGGQETWGIHGWNTWRRVGEGAPSYSEDVRASFWLPTLQYFCELPFRLESAEIVDCGGPTKIAIEGVQREVNQVYATWGRYAPHPRFDQYLAFVDAQSGFLVRADFTVRDLAGFAKGRVLYRDFRQVGDYWLPHRIQIGGDPPEDMLHELVIESWNLGDAKVAIPDPSLPQRAKP